MKKYDYYEKKALKAADKFTTTVTIACAIILVLMILGHAIFS